MWIWSYRRQFQQNWNSPISGNVQFIVVYGFVDNFVDSFVDKFVDGFCKLRNHASVINYINHKKKMKMKNEKSLLAELKLLYKYIWYFTSALK